MLTSIRYNIQDGLKGLWRNQTMTFASIASVTASLFVLGMILVVLLNVNHVSTLTKDRFNLIQVFMVDDMELNEMNAFRNKISAVEGVSSISFESKETALENMKIRWGEDADLLENLENNPMQNSFKIQVADLRFADQVVEIIKEDPFTDDITYYKDVVDKMLIISNLISTAGIIIISILFLLSLFNISNTIKIVLFSRRREINIMKYVGATDWFIRWPFIIEGFFLGFIGSAIAAAITLFLYQLVSTWLYDNTFELIGNYILPISSITNSILLVFFVTGAGVGILGSLLSLRRHLEV